MGCTSTGGTIPRTAWLSNDILVKTTVYALCIALVFMLLVGVGSADRNKAPVANYDVATTSEDTPVTADVLSNDSDSEDDTLTVTEVTNPANGAAVINADYTVTYTPNADFNGADSYTYTISDGNGRTATATVTILVGAANDAPVLNPISTVTISETETATIVLIASDPDDNPITYSKNVAFGTLSGNTFTWPTSYGDSGSYNIEFTVSDGDLTDTETGVINVGNTNKAPVLSPIGDQSVNENTTLSFAISASDDDGDTLTYSAVDLPTNATLNGSSGVFEWTPTYDKAGTYSVQFNVTDGIYIDSENVVITVNDVNRAPILGFITGIQINEAETATIVLTAYDPDGDFVIYSKNVSFGVLIDSTFTWTSGYDDDGIYYLEFTVSDGDLTDTEIGVIVVGDADRTPVIDYIGPKSVDENSLLSFTVNASDPDGDTLTYSAIGLPTGATLNSSNGLFKWIPADNQSGTYPVKFEVADGIYIDSENVAITVKDVNTDVTPLGFGDGGGGGSTGEEFENIEVRDVIRVYVNINSTIVYKFKEEINAIDFIRFDAKRSAGYIATTIEVLKDTSALVSTAPSGKVYQNMNIWVGDAIYATGDRIANPIIEFKVARSWITENNIDISKIQLCRYSSGVWNPLPTTKINEDEKYIYFTSKTPGFSPFAITGTKISNTPITNTLTENMPAPYFTTPSTLTDDVNTPVSETADVPVQEEEKSSGAFALVMGLIGISVFVGGIVIKKGVNKEWIEKTKEWIENTKEWIENTKEWIDEKTDSGWEWDIT